MMLRVTEAKLEVAYDSSPDATPLKALQASNKELETQRLRAQVNNPKNPVSTYCVTDCLAI